MKLLKSILALILISFTFITCDTQGPFTLYFDIAEEGGDGVYFYVYELETYEKAKKIIEGFQGFYNENIVNKNAEEVAQEFLYLEVYAPVCGKILENENKDYENDYNFKGQVFLKAHEDGKAYGYWKKGKCEEDKIPCGGIAGFQCPDGFTCVMEDTYPDAMGHCEKIECPALMPPNPDMCLNGTFEPVYDEENICIVGFECIQHKPVCKYYGYRNEGWYWQDTGERIKGEKCEGKTVECVNIGTRSEGWNIQIGDHVLWDFCAEEVGITR